MDALPIWQARLEGPQSLVRAWTARRHHAGPTIDEGEIDVFAEAGQDHVDRGDDPARSLCVVHLEQGARHLRRRIDRDKSSAGRNALWRTMMLQHNAQ